MHVNIGNVKKSIMHMQIMMRVKLFQLAVYVLLITQLGTCHGLCQSDNNQQEVRSYVQQLENVSTNTAEPLSPSCHGPWTIAESKGNTTSCQCGSNLGGLVKCDGNSFDVQVLTCYCMTHYEKDPNITVVGACLYACHQPIGRGYHGPVYCGKKAPDRYGQLCGSCSKNFSPPVYSYDWHCVNNSLSSGYSKHWIKYIAVAYVPLTIFFLVITMFQISVPSPSMSAFILVSQLSAAPVQMRILTDQLGYNTRSVQLFIQSGLSLYGVWNLDFFRLVYSPFTLGPSIGTLQILALDYAVAAYPLFLIVATYILVELHDNDFRIVVWLWKPFHYCFACYRRQWDIRTSLVDTFATFFLLSYVKFLSASFDLLFPVYLYNVRGETIDKYLYYDGTIEYFGKQHLPYAILAIVVLILVNLLPVVLLLLYPCQCFQKLLNFCGLRCHALHTFIDVFQGSYKNRTDGTYDRRWFSAVYLLVRLAFLTVFAMIQNCLMGCFFEAMLLTLTAILVGVVQPYKSHIQNAVDVVLILTTALAYSSGAINRVADIEYLSYNIPSGILAIIFGLVPLFYMSTVALYWLILRKKIPQKLYSKLRNLLPCVHSGSISHSSSEQSLPDRLANPEEYEPLLHGSLGNVLGSDGKHDTFEAPDLQSSY